MIRAAPNPPPRGGGGPRSGGGATALTKGTPRKTVYFARQLRSKMSLPEVLIWQKLRIRPFGLRFRRQHPIGPYVADFLHIESRLVIEIDGQDHDSPDRFARDEKRDAWLASQSLAVVRIPAKLVLSDIDAAMDAITGAVLSRVGPSTTLRAVPLPLTGED